VTDETRIPTLPSPRAHALRVGLAVMSLALPCCGGSSPSSPSSVTVISRSTGTTGASGATITITSSGVSPASVSISVGQSVTFVNSDSRTHEMDSNPHPEHGSCPSIDAGVGLISPGQTKVTQGFADAGTCGFHDHQDASNSSLTGSIVIR
jgi:plastocyanin